MDLTPGPTFTSVDVEAGVRALIENQYGVEKNTLDTPGFTSGAFEGYAQYDWCPKVVLDKVPPDIVQAAEAVLAYRREAGGGDG